MEQDREIRNKSMHLWSINIYDTVGKNTQCRKDSIVNKQCQENWTATCESQRRRNSTQSAKAKPGTDWGSDQELLIAKFRRKLKKVGKTISHSAMALIKPLTIIQWK